MLSQPERVLIVDDDELALEAMAESIGVLGLQVSTADNGETAWEMFEREDHDLVVTDVRMPQHDGLSLTAQVKAYRPSCPVILVTGYGGEKTAIAALRAGASDFLVKPFQLSELHASVERACSLVRAQRGRLLGGEGRE